MAAPHRNGLVEVGDGVFAYLQRDGGWGWSNAGLVTDGDASLLVDTLFDMTLTRTMLDTMRSITETAPIATIVNTHANGDHCYGNGAVDAEEIIASNSSAREMDEVPASMLAGLLAMAPEMGDVGAYFERIFGSFRFDEVEPSAPTRTFDGSLSISVGDLAIDLVEVGPAHTGGDVIVELPDRDTVFTGDILFNGGTPVVWAGPFGNWIDACDRIIEAGWATIVPGHGQLATADDVRTLRDYLAWLLGEVRPRQASGLTVEQTIADIDLGSWADLGDAERLAVNVDTAYAELDPAHRRADAVTNFTRMAALAG
ncbi:MBL fold metallo-hydrolase [Actinospongicola halichondriae]|uniref:MBL fold metallo-hydrolase n=1 Tax=Actinospongicola halichondriae TaxID=3236844 RepID=UPI003D504751